MAFVDIPKERLDRWWFSVAERLAKDPGDWDAVRDQCLLENEYQRKGWTPPCQPE